MANGWHRSEARSASWRPNVNRLWQLVAVVAAVVMASAVAGAVPVGAARPSFHSEGRVVVVVGMGSQAHGVEYFLRVAGVLYRLDLPEPRRLEPNTLVNVEGDRSGRVVDVSRLTIVGSASPATSAVGAQSVLVMPVYWGSPDAHTASDFTNQINADSAYYHENSYGLLSSLTPTVTPWLHIAAPPNCDDLSTLESEASAAASAAGYDAGAYTHDMIYTSSNDCVGRSWAEVGGSWTLIQGLWNNYRTTHELGHNLGLWHAHSLSCTDSGGNAVAVSDNCTTDEYGDNFDVMGYSWLGESGANEFNASQKDLLGWLNGRSQLVTGSGTFVLAPFEQAATALQALEIKTPARTYWIEGRQALGHDSDLPTGATGGAVVHVTDPGNGSWLVDMTPGTPNDFDDAALPVGSSWSDPEGVFSLRVNADSPSGLNVTITTAGSVARNVPAVVARTSSNMDVFYRDGAGNLRDEYWTSANGWRNTTLTAGMVGDAAVVARTSSNMDVFYRDGAGNLRDEYWTSANGWRNTTLTAGMVGDAAVVARTSSNMDVFYRDGAGNLRDEYWTSANGWRNTTLTAGMVGDAAVVARTSSNMDVFYRDGAGNLRDEYWTSANGWRNTTLTAGMVGDAAVVARTSSNMDVFYRDGAGNLRDEYWTSANGWRNTTLTAGMAGDAAVVARTSSNMDVFYRDGAGNLRDEYWTSANGWRNTTLTAGMVGDAAVVARTSKNMDVFYGGGKGKLRDEYWTSANGWHNAALTTGAATGRS